MIILILMVVAMLALGSGISAAPAEGAGNFLSLWDEYLTVGTTASFKDAVPNIRKLAARQEDPYPQWLKDLLIGGIERGWFGTGPQIVDSTSTNPGGPVPSQVVSDPAPPPPPSPRKVKRDITTQPVGKRANTLHKRQTLTPEQRKVFQLEVFKLYIDTLARAGNNLSSLCRIVNTTALERDGIEGDAASSYLCAKATAPVTSTTASLTVNPSELATLPVQNSPVTSIPLLTANASTMRGTATTETMSTGTVPTSKSSTDTENTSSPPAPTAALYGYQKRAEPNIEEMAAYICANVDVSFDGIVDAEFLERYEDLCLGDSD